jgi:hypothetical protein
MINFLFSWSKGQRGLESEADREERLKREEVEREIRHQEAFKNDLITLGIYFRILRI